MLKLKTLLVLALLAATATPVTRAATAVDAFEQNRRLGRGVNIIGYDPLWRSQAEGRFKAKHFQRLHEAGFTSVRINLMPFRVMQPADGWKIPASWWAVLDWAVQQSLASHLMPILDLHEFTAMGADPEQHKKAFLAFWRQLSAHEENAPADVVFEILNEPSKKLTPALWNQYLKEALAVIRETNPERTVIIGPAFSNGIEHLPELELPENDRNIIVTVHYYHPMTFTHQGAPWSAENVKLHDIAWEGSPAERAKLAQEFGGVTAWAKAHHRPIFLGEFGAYDKAPMASRVRYIDAVAREAERQGWSWAYWQFDSDFLLWDMKRDTWVEPIRDALIPRGEKR